MNKKGFTILEVVFGIIVFGILVLIVGEFKTNVTEHKLDIIKQESFYSHIDTELTNLFAEGFTYEDKEIETNFGPIEVNVEDLGKTEYGTNLAKVSFNQGKFKQEFEIERGEHYHEE